MDRLFSREDAEQLLPQLRPLLEEIRTHANALDAARARLALMPATARHNGRAQEASTLEAAIADHVETITRLASEVEQSGAEIKDLRTGLIDFRSPRDGRIVYLCWRLGEPRILYWHHLDAGIAGRQPLDS
jgi:hypothetical protein